MWVVLPHPDAQQANDSVPAYQASELEAFNGDLSAV